MIAAIETVAQAVPVHHYDEEAARAAWSDYQRLCLEENAIREKRLAAHQRFVAAFTAADA